MSITGKRMYLWRAVDSEGEVLDIVGVPGRKTADDLSIGPRPETTRAGAL